MTIPSEAGLEAMLAHEEQGMPVVSVFGEVDLSTAQQFESVLATAVSEADDAGAIADLRGMEFMDVMGIHALLQARRSLNTVAPHGRLFIVCHGQVSHLLRVVGLEQELDLCADLYEVREVSRRWASGPSPN